MNENARPNHLVRDVMQTKLITVTPGMTIRELIQILFERGITGAPVLDERGRVLGVVSGSDVLRLAAHEAEIPAGQLSWEPRITREEMEDEEVDTPTPVPFTLPAVGTVEAAFDEYLVSDIMTPVAFSVRPDDTLDVAVRFLLKGRIHRVLVLEGDRLVGIVTPFDMLGAVEWDR